MVSSTSNNNDNEKVNDPFSELDELGSIFKLAAKAARTTDDAERKKLQSELNAKIPDFEKSITSFKSLPKLEPDSRSQKIRQCANSCLNKLGNVISQYRPVIVVSIVVLTGALLARYLILNQNK